MDNNLKVIYGIRIFVIVASIFFLPLVSSALTDGLISYYNFDEASGDLIDQASTYDGTVVGADYEATGIINYAYDFELGDAGDYIQTGLPILTDADFSISVWVKIESYSGIDRIINWRNSGNDNSIIELSTSVDKVFFRLRGNDNSGLTTLYTSTTLNTGTWYHIVATFDQSTGEQKVYLNATTPTSVNYTGGAITFNKAAIGGDWNLPSTTEFPNGCWYDGLVDELGIWNRILDSTEVSELWNNGNGLTYPFVVDTCTCPGAGNDWEVDMSDYCNITDACDLTTGTLSFTGAGWCNCSAKINTTNLGDPGSSGTLWIYPQCEITIN